MKKIVIFYGILIIGVGCNSGTQKNEENRAAKVISKMTAICQLTPDQSAKLEPIVETFIKTKVDNRDKYASDQPALRKADSVNKRHYIDTLKKILTPDQFEKFKAARAQMKANKNAGQDNGGEQE